MKKLIFSTTLALAVTALVIWSAGRLSAPARAQAVVIDFETVAQGPVTNQYAQFGITFNNLTVLRYPQIPGFTHSGVQAAEACFAQEFCSAPIDMRFTSAQRRVKVWVGLSSTFGSTVSLRALDANGAQVGQATAVFNTSTGPQLIRTPLEVTLTNASIRRVLVSFAAANSFNNSLAVDDIEFDNAGPPPPCTSTQVPTLNIFNRRTGRPCNSIASRWKLRSTHKTHSLPR